MLSLHQRSLNVNGASPSGSVNPNDDLVHFCHVAALIVTVYDHLITLDCEVEYIWKKRWSKSKVLYILARYFGDILLISICVVFLNRDASYMASEITCLKVILCQLLMNLPLSCKLFMFYFENNEIDCMQTFLLPYSCSVGLKFVGTGSMVIIIITQLIMQLRIKALYGHMISKLITAFWVMEVTAVLSLGIASLAAIDVHPVILNTTRMCNPTYLPRYAFLFWVPVIVFESFLFSLALRIAYQNYREIGTWRGVSLLYIVLRDNFSFFVCAFALYIITATTWLTANPRYFTVPGSFSCSLTTIMGSRLILNLCEAYHHPPDPDATPPPSIWAAATSANIQFLSALPHAHAHGSRTTKSRSVASVWHHRRWRRARGGDADVVDTQLGRRGMVGDSSGASHVHSAAMTASEGGELCVSVRTASGGSIEEAEEHELQTVEQGAQKTTKGSGPDEENAIGGPT